MQMLENDVEDGFSSPRVSSCAAPFSPLSITLSRKSFSYNKLHQVPLKLTVRKLDHSSFDIEVVKTATVAELKQAVESSFSYLPKKGPGKVSWSHVWGQFCLCYDSQKLLTDSDYIGAYGIKDGDQLQFARHVSINYEMVKARSEKQVTLSKKPRMSRCRSDCEESKQNGEEDDRCDPDGLKNDRDIEEDKSVIRPFEYKLANLLRGWFSFRRLPSSEMRFEQKSSRPRFNYCFLGSFKSIVRLYTNKIR